MNVEKRKQGLISLMVYMWRAGLLLMKRLSAELPVGLGRMK